MDAILKGGSLRHVPEEQRRLPCTDMRGKMLDLIRQGVNLRKVKEEARKSVSEATGIDRLFQKALQERRMAVSTPSSEESKGEDDEWND